MSSESNSPKTGQHRELNLQKMAGQFMAAVQRHLDMLAFNLAAQEGVTEEAYVRRAHADHLRPLGPAQPNVEQIQAFARDLLMRQALGDALNLAVTALNNTHLFLAFIKVTDREQAGNLPPEAQQQAQASQQAFVKEGLSQKFDWLEENYGVLCGLEDTINAMNHAMEALMRQGGTIEARQLNEDGELAFELQRARPGGGAAGGEPWFNDVETTPKVFREGDRVVFSEVEMQQLFYTVAVFAHQIFTSVTRYARDRGQAREE